MPTKEEVMNFLHSLQWKIMSKKELQEKLQNFLHTKNKLEDSTQEEKEFDYSFIFTNGMGSCTNNFIDVEIYYLKMREKNMILITGTELLMYEK